MTASIIDSIIDGSDTYAYAFLQRDRDYGHMTVNIRFSKRGECGGNRGKISITSQIGGGSFGSPLQSDSIYAWRFGYETDINQASLADLREASHVMNKIDKYLARVEANYGTPDSFAEYCQRIVIGSGAKQMISEPTGWVQGGLMRHKDLDSVGRHSKEKLTMMQSSLLETFARKAA